MPDNDPDIEKSVLLGLSTAHIWEPLHPAVTAHFDYPGPDNEICGRCGRIKRFWLTASEGPDCHPAHVKNPWEELKAHQAAKAGKPFRRAL